MDRRLTPIIPAALAFALLSTASAVALTPSSSAAVAAGDSVLGEQRTLVILVNFQDDTRQPYTAAYANDLVFNTVSNFFRENSYGAAWLSGETAGWFTIPMSASTCDASMLASLAEQAAARAGFDVAAYSRFVYGFPGTPCGWAGYATVGGLPARAWIGTTFPASVVAHEVGHTLGLGHAAAIHCDGSPSGSSCTTGELADPIDVMACTSFGHLNAFHKDRMGWFAGGAAVNTVQSSGAYTIDPLESQGAGWKALKILKGVDQLTGVKTWYYVETRRALGYDAFLPGGTNALAGVLVHTGSESADRRSYLLDMTAATTYYADSALPVGTTFTDPQSGVSITPVSVGDSGATISVTLGTAACAPAAPTVTLSPAQSSAVAPGSSVSYTLTVANHDSAPCGSATFGLQAIVPAGWSAAFSTQSVTVAAGGSASASLRVTSATTAAAGTYAVSATAADAWRSASALASYVVAQPKTRKKR